MKGRSKCFHGSGHPIFLNPLERPAYVHKETYNCNMDNSTMYKIGYQEKEEKYHIPDIT